jgi:hypothetical protein
MATVDVVTPPELGETYGAMVVGAVVNAAPTLRS